jgi:predicted transcriptional regulator YdeE
LTPTLLQVEPFCVAGISTRTKNADESSPETGKLGKLWQRFYQESIAEKIPHQDSAGGIYGVYSSYESDVNGEYSVTAGMKVSSVESIGDLSGVDVAGGDYLMFEAKGEMPQVVINTWLAVWNYFKDNGELRRKYTTDFEHYKAPGEVAIYIAVERI